MTRAEFEKRRVADWIELERLLDRLDSRSKRADARNAVELPAMYRGACEDLALAKHRGYGSDLVERLNGLALRAYHQIHGVQGSLVTRSLAFLAVGFPRLVRANGGVVSLAALLFFGPFFAFLAAGFFAPEWVFAVVPVDQRITLEQSFGSPPDSSDFGRGAEGNVKMFGFYVYNNVSIDFRTFAGGILGGIGSLFFLLVNGVMLGAAFGYAFVAGVEETFLAFTAGHGGPELLAIVVSGAAGLRLGLAILSPGRRTRAHALIEDGREALHLALGAGAMTTFAAFIEAFWSATPTAANVKYVVGVLVWTGTLAWLLLAGRRRALAPADGSVGGPPQEARP